jgi:hypothetical protein
MPARRDRLRLLRLVALLLCGVLLASLSLPFVAAADDTCACGMRNGCSCKLVMAREGAHCAMRGPSECSMRSSRQPGADALLASFDLRGWARPEAVREPKGDREPSGSIQTVHVRLPESDSPDPLTPPPRSFQAV